MWSRHTKKRLAVFECRLKHTDGVATLPRVLKKINCVFLEFLHQCGERIFSKSYSWFHLYLQGTRLQQVQNSERFPAGNNFCIFYPLLC